MEPASEVQLNEKAGVLDDESEIRMKMADIYRAISRGNCSGEQLRVACGRVTEAALILEGGITLENVKA